jgi:hemoglobin/transferrin/lactoferrin receptor protein
MIDPLARHMPCVSSFRTALLAGAAILLVPAAASAQNANVLKPVTVVGASDEVSAGGVSVDAEEIESRNPEGIKDVFRNTPGVEVGGASELTNKVYVYGMEDSNLNKSVDGVRNSDNSWHHIGNSVIDPGLLKSVRVEPGVAPADAGPDALGGSIEYETKDARDIVEPGKMYGGFTRLSYDTNTHGFSETAVVAGQHSGVEVLGYIMNSSGNNHKDGNGNIQQGSAPEMLSATGKFAFNGTGGHRLEVKADYVEDVGVRPARPNFVTLNNALGTRENMIEYYNQSISISYVDEEPTDWINPEIELSYNKNQLTAYSVTAGPVTSDFGSDISSLAGKAANTFTNRFGTITTGLDFYHDEATGTRQGRIGAACEAGTSSERASNVGAFAQFRVPVTDEWRMSFGGRVDNQWFHGTDGADHFNYGFSGNANTEYDAFEWLTAYAGAGTTFGGIPLGEAAIYDFSAIWTSGGVSPSRSYNFKTGLNAEYEGFTGNLGLFYNDIEDDHDLSSYRRSTAFDLVTRGFTLGAGYRYQDAFVKGNWSHTIVRMDGVPPSSGSAAYFGQLQGDLFSLEAGYEFTDYGVRTGATSEMALRNDEVEELPLPGYVVVNLYTEYTPKQAEFLTLRLDAKNITDQPYVDRLTTGADNANANPYYEPGRSFLLSAKAKF